MPDVIVLTGFGPFGEHRVNASWEVVKLVRTLDVERDLDCTLVTEELPVDYKLVADRIPELWRLHQPALAVHVGVSSLATGLTVECRAFGDGYVKPDVNGNTPCDHCCGGADARPVIDCGLDVAAVCKAVNAAGLPLNGQKSTFAGRYLCEFAYYTSLSVDAGRAIFVHVPALGKGLTALEMARGIVKVLEELMMQIRSRA